MSHKQILIEHNLVSAFCRCPIMSRPTRRGSGSSPKKGKGSPTKEGPNEKIGIPTTSDNTEEVNYKRIYRLS